MTSALAGLLVVLAAAARADDKGAGDKGDGDKDDDEKDSEKTPAGKAKDGSAKDASAKDGGSKDGGSKKAEGDDEDDDQTLAQKAAERFPQPVAVGALLDRRVLAPLESQPVLGRVKDIVRAGDGTIQAVIAYGGVFGIGARRIAVPIDAMALLSPDVEIVEFEPEELDRFPTFDAAGTVRLAPATIIKVGLAKPSH